MATIDALTAQVIADHLGGTVDGDPQVAITGLAGLESAKQGDISFLANPRYKSAVATTRASAVLVDEKFDGDAPCTLIRVKSADAAFARAAAFFGPPPIVFPVGVHPTAVVSGDVELGEGVSVGPHCVIEPGARIGAGSVLVASVYVGHETTVGAECKFYPFASIRERCVVGDRVILHNGAVVGSDGFGYVHPGAAWEKVPQIGIVVLGNDVELGANVTVDRARFGKTVIEDGVKIDNLVQIAHNVHVGAHTAMAAQVGISGSSTVGSNCMLGGQAGIAGHLAVGDGAIVGAQSGVARDVPSGEFVIGSPAMPRRETWKAALSVQKLPELRAEVKDLKRRLEKLEKGDSLQ